MPTRARIAVALAAFPAGWGIRQAFSPAVGGIVVIAAIAACCLGLPRHVALRLAALGVLCFVAVHLIAYVTTDAIGLACGALAFGALVARTWAIAPARSAIR